MLRKWLVGGGKRCPKRSAQVWRDAPRFCDGPTLTESDFLAAKARAAIARQVRTRILAARLLGVDPSKLSNVKVEVVSSSEFRNRKSQEQAEYWKDLREKSLEHVAHVDQRRARTAAIVRPTSFRLNGKESANRT